MRRCPWMAVALLALFPSLAFAVPINIGLISFDVLIPGGGTPGVNVFNVSNLTGGFALPPDFPALDPLVFLNSSLTLTDGGTPTVISLGNLGPGALDPTIPVQFPDSALFSSAIFVATLSQTSFLLSDGTTFVAASSAITVELLPSFGPSLVPGADFALITVSPSPVPEPGTLFLLGTGLMLLIGIKTPRRD